MRWLSLSALLAVSGACDCGASHPVDAGRPDAPIGDAAGDTPRPLDAPDGTDAAHTADVASIDTGVCRSWQLVDADTQAIVRLGSAPVHPGRTVQVVLEIATDACSEPAMFEPSEVDEDARTVRLRPRSWSASESCEATLLRRPVALGFASVGTWRVVAGDASLDVEVVDAPDRPCGADPCALDCDCDVGRCLSDGAGATGCAIPCEHDADCPGSGCRPGATPGEFTCSPRVVCDDGDCGPLHDCFDGHCIPSFELSSRTRVPCGCDGECAPGLSCVRADDPAEPARCERRCGSDGWWCPGMHRCGEREEDVSGLAPADAVCGWLGE